MRDFLALMIIVNTENTSIDFGKRLYINDNMRVRFESLLG